MQRGNDQVLTPMHASSKIATAHDDFKKWTFLKSPTERGSIAGL